MFIPRDHRFRAWVRFGLPLALGLAACAPPRAEIHPPAGCPCGPGICERTYTQCGLEQDQGGDAAVGSCGDRYVACCFGGPGCTGLGGTWIASRRRRDERAAHATPGDAGPLHTVFDRDAGARSR